MHTHTRPHFHVQTCIRTHSARLAWRKLHTINGNVVHTRVRTQNHKVVIFQCAPLRQALGAPSMWPMGVPCPGTDHLDMMQAIREFRIAVLRPVNQRFRSKVLMCTRVWCEERCASLTPNFSLGSHIMFHHHANSERRSDDNSNVSSCSETLTHAPA